MLTKHNSCVNSVSFQLLYPIPFVGRIAYQEAPALFCCLRLHADRPWGIPCCLVASVGACLWSCSALAWLDLLLQEVRVLERGRHSGATVRVSRTQKGTHARAILRDSVFWRPVFNGEFINLTLLRDSPSPLKPRKSTK